jgi:pimeloyl-ACP methyl ester carboxylesterase/DNA-binding CsgD family transcriptional regulator
MWLGTLTFFRNSVLMSDTIPFLERMRRAIGGGEIISALTDDPNGFGAALRDETNAFEEILAEATSDRFGATVILHEDSFASAACDRHGSVVVAEERFQLWFDDLDPFSAVVRNVQADSPRVSLFADDRDGRPVALAAGTVAMSRAWPLGPAVREALTSGAASYAIIAFRPGDRSWTQAAQAYGLTPAESGLVGALARSGDLQIAALERGIAYETARKFVASALRKTGAKRQTDLIRQTLAIAAGDVPDGQNLAQIIRDIFALTERQASLAILIANGAMREHAASILKISDNRAKADLKIVYLNCGVTSAVDLSRIVAEIDALKGLAVACEVIIRAPGRDGEPLRLVPRSWADGVIAVSDHGPEGAKPVLLFHSNVSGRFHSRSFIKALRDAGYRPITFDRAGYGLSDPVDSDPVIAGVRDAHDVLDALGLPTALGVARCTTASLIACAAHPFGRITGGVLVWPDPPHRPDRPEKRMTHHARAVFTRYPEMALAFTKLLTRRSNRAMIERSWRSAAKGVASDEAVLDNPEEMEDIIRGAQQCILGMKGFMNEAMANNKGPNPELLDDASRWTLLFGSGYEKYDTSDAAAFWSAAMPGAKVVTVPDGVHFLHVTHKELVVKALERAQSEWGGTSVDVPPLSMMHTGRVGTMVG